MSISPSGLIAAGSRDGTVDVWTAHDRRLVGTLPVGRGPVVVALRARTARCSPLLAEEDHQLSVWDASTLTMVGDPLTD